MLVLSRKTGECIRIGQEIEVTVLEVRGGRAKLGIRLPLPQPPSTGVKSINASSECLGSATGPVAGRRSAARCGRGLPTRAPGLGLVAWSGNRVGSGDQFIRTGMMRLVPPQSFLASTDRPSFRLPRRRWVSGSIE